MERGELTDAELVDHRADGVDEPGRQRCLNRAVAEVAKRATDFGKGQGAKLHGIGAGENQQDAGGAEQGQALMQKQDPPDRYVNHGGLGKGVGQRKITVTVRPTVEQMVEYKAGAPGESVERDFRAQLRERLRHQPDNQVEHRPGAEKHPPDENGLVPALLDQQIPEGMGNCRQDDKDKRNG